jgi:parallel beta-helix repeat protein
MKAAIHLSVLATYIVAAQATLAQGPLAPPAFPAPDPALNNLGQPIPNMKTLTQVEPRVPISAAQTPGDVDALFKITQPGSYYLTGNVTGVPDKHGIEIAASDVTLDLNGFTIRSSNAPTDGITGITTAGVARDGITIRNGRLFGWPDGAIAIATASRGAVLEQLVINSGANSGGGVVVGVEARIFACTVTGANATGISTQERAVIEFCQVFNSAGGINVGNGSTVKNCLVRQNTGGVGIVAANSSAIEGNMVYGNASGIHVGTDCVVRGNTLESNNFGSPSVGILAQGSSNLIDSNAAYFNGTNIKAESGTSGNVVIRNMVHGGTAFSLGGQIVGPSITTAGTITSENPWANFAPP